MREEDTERIIANQIADYWYRNIHGQVAPIFGKQKLRDFVEEKLKELHEIDNECYLPMSEFTKAQIIEHSQLVVKGSKPCSVLPVKYLNADYALVLSKEQGCKCFICETDDENWCELWIYKRDEMRAIIEQLPSKPQSKIEHFVLGCAFGYSIDSILDFIGRDEFLKQEKA